MNFRRYDCVVAVRDFPERGICAGDFGGIVEIYENGACEVELIESNGYTKALFAVEPQSLRRAEADELPRARNPAESETTE